MAYLTELVGRKRTSPGDDLLSGLVTGGELSDEELTGMGLLQHPDQAARLRDDPAAAERAVEELLRYLTIAHIGPMRLAKKDVELAGQTIRAGKR